MTNLRIIPAGTQARVDYKGYHLDGRTLPIVRAGRSFCGFPMVTLEHDGLRTALPLSRVMIIGLDSAQPDEAAQ